MSRMFTSERLALLCPKADPQIASQIADTLAALATGYGVTTPLRAAHFMAQAAHESAGLTKFEENLDYSAPRIITVWPRLASRAANLAGNPEALGNAAYGGHFGNGPESSGDGWRYRGRGLVQITFRDNYSFFGAATGLTLASTPALASEPTNAAHIALAFWRSRACNDAANRDDCAGVTRRINGTMLEGLAERQALTDKAKTIFLADTEALIA